LYMHLSVSVWVGTFETAFLLVLNFHFYVI
jgi:hypothetical protein